MFLSGICLKKNLPVFCGCTTGLGFIHFPSLSLKSLRSNGYFFRNFSSFPESTSIVVFRFLLFFNFRYKTKVTAFPFGRLTWRESGLSKFILVRALEEPALVTPGLVDCAVKDMERKKRIGRSSHKRQILRLAFMNIGVIGKLSERFWLYILICIANQMHLVSMYPDQGPNYVPFGRWVLRKHGNDLPPAGAEFVPNFAVLIGRG